MKITTTDLKEVDMLMNGRTAGMVFKSMELYQEDLSRLLKESPENLHKALAHLYSKFEVK